MASKVTKTVAFEGRVVFNMRHWSLRTTIERDKLAAHLGDALKEHKEVADSLLYMLAITDGISFDFDGKESVMLEDLRDFWQAYEKAQPKQKMQLATEWRFDAALVVTQAWESAALAANKPFVNPVIAPLSMLSPEDRKEAEQAGSPLASSDDTPEAA